LVDRLPTTSAELENRESLATVAASGYDPFFYQNNCFLLIISNFGHCHH